MQRPTNRVWISTAILVGVFLGIVPTEAVAQPPGLTRELDSPSRGDRYAEHFNVLFEPHVSVANKTITPVIPDGKKLLLQSVSMHTMLTNGQSLMQAGLGIYSGRNAVAFIYVDMDFQAVPPGGGGQQRHFTGNRDINMVLNAGETITAGFLRNGDRGPSSKNLSMVTLIGYFVDVDPTTPPSP